LTSAVICSNHVAQCIRAARPDDYETYFRYRPNRMWPGGLHYDLQALLWDSQYNPIKGHIHQFGDAAVRANATHYLKGLIDLSELAHRLESSTRTVTPASRSERKPRMAKYRSKPVEIQAWKITAGDSIRQLMDLIESRGGKVARPAVGFDSTAVLSIRTLEGDMIAGIGDWIIQGTEGEFYPCKDTVFQRKYEPADG
jgi:hypothetical protein